jgi:putative transcriptional regulator
MERCLKCDGLLEIIKDQPYHYKESGLDYVWLIGVLQYKCKKCGDKSVEIPCINELHLLIGKDIVCKKQLLIGAEVRFLRKEIGMKSKEMAAALSIEPETYSRWENDKRQVEACHDKSLRMIYVMNASESTGKVLSQGSRTLLHEIAAKKAPKRSKKILYSPSEWMNRLGAPIFGFEACDCTVRI